MTSLGENCYVGTLHYQSLDPPVGGGGSATLQDVCNNGNTTTTAIGCADLSCGDVNCDAIVSSVSLDINAQTDQYPPDKSIMYKEIIDTGLNNRQTGAGQDNFNNSTTAFPTKSPLWWIQNAPTTALHGIIGRRTGATLPVGTIGNQLGFGTKSLFQDSVIYDPLQLRYAPAVPNSFSAVRFGDNCIGWNGAGNRMDIIVYAHFHLEGSWGGSNTNNDLKIFIRHFDSAGAVRRDYQLARISGKATTDVVESADRLIMGFAPYSEDINGNDYFEVWMEVVATSVNPFTISLFKGIIEVKPVP